MSSNDNVTKTTTVSFQSTICQSSWILFLGQPDQVQPCGRRQWRDWLRKNDPGSRPFRHQCWIDIDLICFFVRPLFLFFPISLLEFFWKDQINLSLYPGPALSPIWNGVALRNLKISKIATRTLTVAETYSVVYCG